VHKRELRVVVEGLGVIEGDLAWGGNWFFLTPNAPCAIEPANVSQLSLAAQAIKDALAGAQIRGTDGAEIDHRILWPIAVKRRRLPQFRTLSGRRL